MHNASLSFHQLVALIQGFSSCVSATTLTGFHFSVTTLIGWISNATGYSESKSIPFWELLWFSIITNTSIVAMNFNLMLNSVGFYQISKLSRIPVVCVLEWILHGKQYSREVKMVVTMVVSVGVCTVTDVKVNVKGFLCALVAILCTSLQKISIGSLQKKYSIGSFELLSKTAPIQALSLLTVGPFIDYCLTSKSLLKYNYTFGAFCFILLSYSLAVFCNISQYLCIGRFSVVSFQVLGHMKTVCVLMLGWLLFDSEMTLKNISGMVFAIVGMVMYSWAVEIEKKANAMAIPQISVWKGWGGDGFLATTRDSGENCSWVPRLYLRYYSIRIRFKKTPRLGELVRALGGAIASTSLFGVPLGHNSSFLQGPTFAPPRIREVI
ncbi:UDP-rhamnose/UDP-galactose transporter 3-like [Benincasa hispida]|uniref:UDP-rhamnose/UDP-galactose transporter 3-like n=1 Tax=Benincasa hispida TaxID=102211 RepID=UPI0018FFE5D2|nr:UDP-rhamnose/UDP-galactose transporter 3-like [Benincasa hispida]